METFLLFLLGNMIFYGDIAGDPVHVGWKSRQELRQYECERLSQAEAHKRFPADVPPVNPRSQVLFQIDALWCERRVVADGARSARDELILSRLQQDVEELTGLASAEGDEETVWVVDAYHPNPQVVRKVATASRVALVERGYRVSDQPPQLTAGDVEVFRTLPMREALPLACRRLHELKGLEGGPLGKNVAFLSIALIHPAESQLHAGICRGGRFRWLR